jgi:MerR family transcriptional regulator, mercuric resistance operon regulatory protein
MGILKPVAATGSIMKISEAATASGCNLETIRYYERAGLLPEVGRKSNGYRDYGPDQVRQLRFIVRGRALGFSLQEIRELLTLAASSDLPCDQVEQIARQQLTSVRKRIAELQLVASELEAVTQSCARSSRRQCTILDALQHGG